MERWNWTTTSTILAWAILLLVFAAAWLQGAEFASTKDEATVFGAAIGLAAFFAWLGVEDDDDEMGPLANEGDEDTTRAGTGPNESDGPIKPKTPAKKKGD
mmetsp:Transcript_11729/g.27091  ORF Transcript_11729/g.27091 Transcript_11729/m.27091 type:complete len:101 (+) Transcript_11729:869-1171(+)